MTFAYRIRRALLRWLVEDVPADIHACESCRRNDCTAPMMASCPTRLAAEAQLRDEEGLPSSASFVEQTESERCPDSIPVASQTRTKHSDVPLDVDKTARNVASVR